MKAYLIVIENDAKYGPGNVINSVANTDLETAKRAFLEIVNGVEKDPNKYFGLASKEHLRYTWKTDRYVEIRDTFGGESIEIYIHELEII